MISRLEVARLALAVIAFLNRVEPPQLNSF